MLTRALPRPQFSAASLKRRIHELENNTATHDADLARLQTVRDGLAQLVADLQRSAGADAQTIATLRASVAQRDSEVSSDVTALYPYHVLTHRHPRARL